MSTLGGELRKTVALAAPMVLGQVVSHLMVMTDLAMVGRVGVAQVAAATFALNFYGFFWLVAVGVASAVNIFVSEAHGAGDAAREREVTRHGLLVCGGLSLLSAGALIGVVLWTEWWQLSQPAEVVAEARTYLVYLAISIVPLLLHMALRAHCESRNDPWPPLYFLVGSIGLNVLLNWIFIFGHGGAPAMGLDGAGLATALSRFAVLVAFWWWIASSPRHRLRWSLPAFFRINWAECWHLLRFGLPVGLQIIFEVLTFNLAAFSMGWFADGTVAVAAHGIALNYAALAFMVPLGLMMAVSIRVGQARGAGDLPRARLVAWSSLGLSVAFMTCVAALYILGRAWLPHLFLPASVGARAPEVIALASQLLLFAGCFAIFDGIQVVAAGALRGFRDVRGPMVIAFLAYWLICVPFGFYFGFRFDGSETMPALVTWLGGLIPGGGLGWGPRGVWVGLCLGLIAVATALLLRLRVIGRRPGHDAGSDQAPPAGGGFAEGLGA